MGIGQLSVFRKGGYGPLTYPSMRPDGCTPPAIDPTLAVAKGQHTVLLTLYEPLPLHNPDRDGGKMMFISILWQKGGTGSEAKPSYESPTRL